MDIFQAARLRREIRVLRVLVIALVVGVAVVGLFAQTPRNTSPIATTNLSIVDSEGHTRIRLWIDGDIPKVEVLDEKGQVADLVPRPQVRPLAER